MRCLRTFRGGGIDLHWCVDPASMMDLDVVRANLLHRIGEFAVLSLVTMNHRNPDGCLADDCAQWLDGSFFGQDQVESVNLRADALMRSEDRRTPMQPRIEYAKVAPDGVKAMWGLESYVSRCGLEPALLDLVKLRASQINGCAYCIDMHAKDARARGENEQRLYALNAWRETPFFTGLERAALTWAEAVTGVASTHVPDEVYELARQHFSDKELVDLTLAVVAINSWNRLAISFRKVPGTYQPAHQPQARSDGVVEAHR